MNNRLRFYSAPPRCKGCDNTPMHWAESGGIRETTLIVHTYTCRSCSARHRCIATSSRPEQWCHWIDYVILRNGGRTWSQ